MTDQAKLYSPKKIKALLQQYGIRLNKQLGQNFLIDGNVVRSIVAAADLSKTDTVFEIGPGIGTLTQALLEEAGQVISIEIDQQLIPVLKDHFSDQEHFHLLHEDALAADWEGLIEKYSAGRPVKLVANLPYYITSPLLDRLLTSGLAISTSVFMMQKEVAERIMASVGDPEYGSLTLLIEAFAQVEEVLQVPASVFIPQPKVASTVLTFDHKSWEETQGRKQVTDFIQRCFQQRRKTVVNALHHASGADKEEIRQSLNKHGISLKARPENLSWQDYQLLASELI